MAAFDVIASWVAQHGEPPTTNYATLDVRNQHPCLDFDTSTQETIYFTATCPTNYSGNGVIVYLTWAASTATSGTIGWDVSFENMRASSTDIDSDSFATAQTVTATTVPSTSGELQGSNVVVADGTNMDNLTGLDIFRVRIRRDVANDTAAGDAELYSVHIEENT